MRTVSRREAEGKVALQCRNTVDGLSFRSGTAHEDHLWEWKLNLIEGIEPEAIRIELSGGSGGELIDVPAGAPAKFCAPYSSSALCVNTFGLARSNPILLEIFGLSGFTSCRFEQKLPTGLLGTPPNLDLVAESPEVRLAVESKFLEPLSRKAPKFATSYTDAYRQCGDATLNKVYLAVSSGRERFIYLDAAQLLKHALGILKAPRPPQQNVLAYLYWEPTNGQELQPFEAHRQELERFSKLMTGSQIQFRSLSYLELWRSWQSDRCPETIRNHAKRLMARYELDL